jgi:alpha-D-xyloside xylohydrolase
MKWQFISGLNAGMAGMPWWTCDIGGFHGGDIHDPAFHELFVRWFQWGTFLPVMRLHGNRDPQLAKGSRGAEGCSCGADNEVWTFGDKVYGICTTYMELREKMRDYTRGLMRESHEHGDPVIRPMFYQFPQDQTCWIFAPGVTKREVYLPGGSTWRLVRADGQAEGEYFEASEKGRRVTVECPLEYMPVFEVVL